MTSNLLVILSDEHQARAMGCATDRRRQPFVQTPVLDRLAREGTRFTRAYTPCPICVPARAAFATGRYVHQIGNWDNAMPYDGTARGWAHVLQDARVPVESIGKLHYRSPDDPVGFDAEHIPMMVAGRGMVWGSIRKENERRHKVGERMLGSYIGPGQSKYTEYDAAVVSRTKLWFEERAASSDKDPWCLYVGLVAPHFPLVVPQEFYDMYAGLVSGEVKLDPRNGHVRHPWVDLLVANLDHEALFADEDERLRALASYYGLCSWLDHNLGEILDSLSAHGFDENTTVVYSSDHGENLGTRGTWGKELLYDESAAIPMIMRGPGLEAGRVCDTPVSLLDLSTTMTAHLGQDLPDAVGSSLYDLADQPYDPDRVVFSEYHAVGAVTGAFMIVKGDHKLIHYETFAPELFDLSADPEKLINRAEDPAYADILADLRAELTAICNTVDVDAQAHADQRALVASVGGLEAALAMGPVAATPPPST